MWNIISDFTNFESTVQLGKHVRQNIILYINHMIRGDDMYKITCKKYDMKWSTRRRGLCDCYQTCNESSHFGSSRVIWSKILVESSHSGHCTHFNGSSHWKPVDSFTYLKVESRVISRYKSSFKMVVLKSFRMVLFTALNLLLNILKKEGR